MHTLTLIAASLLMTISLTGEYVSAYEALFVVGDSSVDTGNHDKVDPTLNEPWRAPYGVTWPGQPSGRFSDGRVFTDFYASSLHVKSPIPYRVINSTLSSTSAKTNNVVGNSFGGGGGGVNFAYGGSGVFPTFGPQYPNISTQIGELRQLIAKGVVSDQLIRSSIVLLSVAGNDYTVFLQSHSANEISLFIPKVVAQIVASAEELYGLGFKAITVANLHPVGCLPIVTYLNNYTYCNATDNFVLSIPHNTLLASSMAALQMKYLNATFITLDFYNASEAALKGTQLPLRPCCEGIGGASCGDVDSNGEPLYTLCPNPKKSFFWDSYHHTDVASAIISNYLLHSK